MLICVKEPKIDLIIKEHTFFNFVSFKFFPDMSLSIHAKGWEIICKSCKWHELTRDKAKEGWSFRSQAFHLSQRYFPFCSTVGILKSTPWLLINCQIKMKEKKKQWYSSYHFALQRRNLHRWKTWRWIEAKAWKMNKKDCSQTVGKRQYYQTGKLK